MTALSPDETVHLVTGEYPPDKGGVSGYTAEVARGLAGEGAAVHVWCPGREPVAEEHGVRVHRTMGRMTAADLRRVDVELNAERAPRRLVVQWVPHAFGRRSLNVRFCTWVGRRRRRFGDAIDVMVHEPFLEFSWSPRRLVAATVHRAMARTLLATASHVWVSTPAWEARWRPYAPDGVEFEWLPIPATVPVDAAARSKSAELRRALAPAADCVIGSFSPSGPFVEEMLGTAVLPVIARTPATSLLLVGRTSSEARTALVARNPGIADRIHASGLLEPPDVSRYLGACDFAVQPCPDGVCTRHSSVATLLAHGVPVITTDGRFTEPLWRESGGVRLAPAGDGAALRELVSELVHDQSARHRLRTRGADLYESRFHVRHTVAAFTTRREPGPR